MKHAEIDVGRNGIDVARTDEVADERVEQRAIGPDEVDIGKIQECSRAVGDLGFELAQAEFETAAFRKGSIRMGDHGVDPGAGLGRFGDLGLSRFGGTPKSCTCGAGMCKCSVMSTVGVPS